MNNGKRLRKTQRGQGLVEYALILVLVALVVIVAAFLVGQATQRIFGIVLGATGGSTGTSGDLYIAEAYCYMSSSETVTSMYVLGYSSGGLGGLYASDDLQATNVLDQGGSVWHFDQYDATNHSSFFGTPPGFPAEGTPGAFVVDPILATGDIQPQLCPTAITVQDGHGGIAAAPVIVVVNG